MADHDLPNYQSRSFLLQNLSVYDSCMKDETNMIKAREKIKDCSIDQICYYVYCCLYILNYVHSDIRTVPLKFGKIGYRKRPPCILIFGGTGFMGRNVIQALTDAGCGKFLIAYNRTDEHRNRLVSENGPPDIIINCSNASSFSQMTAELVDLTPRHCCFISASNGILRRRMYFIFKTPTVFRTYVEPSLANNIYEESNVKPEVLMAHRIGDIRNITNLLQIFFLSCIFEHGDAHFTDHKHNKLRKDIYQPASLNVCWRAAFGVDIGLPEHHHHHHGRHHSGISNSNTNNNTNNTEESKVSFTMARSPPTKERQTTEGEGEGEEHHHHHHGHDNPWHEEVEEALVTLYESRVHRFHQHLYEVMMHTGIGPHNIQNEFSPIFKEEDGELEIDEDGMVNLFGNDREDKTRQSQILTDIFKMEDEADG